MSITIPLRSPDGFGRRLPHLLRPSTGGGYLHGLHLYGLKIYLGIYGIQLAVQGVERGSLGGLDGPAVHHDAVNVRRTAGWTGQPEARR